MEDGSKLDAHCPRPHDNHGRGDFFQAQNFYIGQDGFAIRLKAGKGLCFRAGRQDDFLCSDFPCLALGVGYADASRRDEPPKALDGFDVILLEQQFDAFGKPGHYLAFPRLDSRPIHRKVLADYPEFLGVFEIIVHLGVHQEGFGRDAAHMQASAAKLVILLDDGRLQAQLARANCGDITSRSAADNHHIKCRGFCQGRTSTG
jgi:hypothetical protein